VRSDPANRPHKSSSAPKSLPSAAKPLYLLLGASRKSPPARSANPTADLEWPRAIPSADCLRVKPLDVRVAQIGVDASTQSPNSGQAAAVWSCPLLVRRDIWNADARTDLGIVGVVGNMKHRASISTLTAIATGQGWRPRQSSLLPVSPQPINSAVKASP